MRNDGRMLLLAVAVMMSSGALAQGWGTPGWGAPPPQAPAAAVPAAPFKQAPGLTPRVDLSFLQPGLWELRESREITVPGGQNKRTENKSEICVDAADLKTVGTKIFAQGACPLTEFVLDQGVLAFKRECLTPQGKPAQTEIGQGRYGNVQFAITVTSYAHLSQGMVRSISQTNATRVRGCQKAPQR